MWPGDFPELPNFLEDIVRMRVVALTIGLSNSHIQNRYINYI